jgi:hypothetical protein
MIFVHAVHFSLDTSLGRTSAAPTDAAICASPLGAAGPVERV